jgi:hypothetical protein
VDVGVGGLIGGLVALIAAWNLLIYLGVEGGYEASLGDAFAHNPLVGALVAAVLAAGPVIGTSMARRQRRKRESPSDANQPSIK